MSFLRDSARLKQISLLLVLSGLAISVYLSYVKLADADVVCAAGGAINCEVVQNSVWSRLAGVDIALLGALAWLVMGATLLLETRFELLAGHGGLLVFGISLFGFLFSMWLIYVQGGILQAWCLWCLAHELAMTLMFLASAARLRLLLAI
ncbi:MAG: vitamin K epoxide reductase family protein [Anaerolineaceae bacterium]|nr:vitamin K epoxide reductase family protein [Anaerolineaceae bacterium]